MPIKNVKVIPGCISCKACENVAPAIFKVQPKSKVISENFNEFQSEILQAEAICPVQVIKVDKAKWFQLKLKSGNLIKKDYLTEDVIELTFKTDWFTATAGQYVSLQMEDWKWKFNRQYSITHFSENSFTLTIKLLEDWRWSKVLKKIKTWKTLNFLWGLWRFILKNTEKEKVFIWTGTGLSPIISMLENTNEQVKKTVIFWVRNKSELFYEDLLQSFKNTEIKIYLSQDKTEDYNYWRVTEEIKNINNDAEVYICGNPNMTDSVVQWLTNQWHSKENIYSEWFVAWKEERNLFKLIILKWTIPYQNILEKIFLTIWLVLLPGLYLYWAQESILYKSWFIWTMSISSLLFALSWYSVVFVMFIRPLSDLLPRIWLLKKLTKFRKSFWIISASIIVTMLLYKYVYNFDNFINYFNLSKWNSLYPFLSRLSEITAIILLITSNNFSQKKLWIWWKRIQRSSYLFFISWALVAAKWWSDSYYYIIWIWWILWLWAFLKNKFSK